MAAAGLRQAYPEHGDPEFAQKLMSLKEYQMFKIPETPVIKTEKDFVKMTEKVCQSFDKLHQHFVEHYLSIRSPYRSILLYHSLGVGKTCSAITVAEAMLAGHTMSEGPRILVISSSALKKSFIEGVRGECTDGYYQKLAGIKGDQRESDKRLLALVKSRYKFITYEGIKEYAKECNESLSNMTIIIDEAHNLRMEETQTTRKGDNKKVVKQSTLVLEKLLQKNANRGNRLILLSATPMYDKSDEIILILSLLMQNDGRRVPAISELFSGTKLTTAATAFLEQAASEYISFIKSDNPFIFAKRFSPDVSGIPVIKEKWARPLKDGIVGTLPGNLQIINPTNYQSGNITYPPSTKHMSSAKSKAKSHRAATGREDRERAEDDRDDDDGEVDIGKGDEGFLKIFNDLNPTSLSLAYNPGFEDALMPTPNNLGRIAAKMLKICDLIRNSKGIVLIYSRFIWYGVVPLAIALEHMGLKRYGPANILSGRPTLVDPMPAKTSYCILNGDKRIMGSTTIDSCIATINSPQNVNGELIKVVLITQVAGEGLSLRNVREVHILEPWFHINRMNQVIGRAIRTCSHNALPLSNRNVTVFLHAIEDKKSADLEVYENILIPKLTKIQKIEDLIKMNAMDCDIMKNMNVYERSKFPFTTIMETSRGVRVPTQFGSEGIANYQCRSSASASTSTPTPPAASAKGFAARIDCG